MYFNKCDTLKELDETRDRLLNQITKEYTARRRYIGNVELQKSSGEVFRRKSVKDILDKEPRINTPLGQVVVGKVPSNEIIINSEGILL